MNLLVRLTLLSGAYGTNLHLQLSRSRSLGPRNKIARVNWDSDLY
jgi:hypothetical protein